MHSAQEPRGRCKLPRPDPNFQNGRTTLNAGAFIMVFHDYTNLYHKSQASWMTLWNGFTGYRQGAFASLLDTPILSRQGTSSTYE